MSVSTTPGATQFTRMLGEINFSEELMLNADVALFSQFLKKKTGEIFYDETLFANHAMLFRYRYPLIHELKCRKRAHYR